MNKQERAVIKMLEALAAMVEKRGFVPQGHSSWTTQYVDMLSEKLKISERDREQIHVAAVAHKIGCLALPDTLADKSNPNAAEKETIQSYVDIGADLVGNQPWLADAAELIRHQNERVDGKGYPKGLHADNIPQGSQIIAMASYFVQACAKVVDDPDGFEKASDDLLLQAGVLFDVKLAQTFITEAQSVFDEKMADFRNQTTNRIARLVKASKTSRSLLPVSGQVIDRVVKMIRKSVSFDQLVRFIEADAGSIIRTVSVANSPAFGGVDSVQDARQAVLRVGIDVVKEVVSDPDGQDLFVIRGDDRLCRTLGHWWQCSLFCGLSAKAISQVTGLGDTNQMYYTSLLRDLGRSSLLLSFDKSVPIANLNRVEYRIVLDLIDEVAWPMSKNIWKMTGLGGDMIMLAEKPKKEEQPRRPDRPVIDTAKELSLICEKMPRKSLKQCFPEFKNVLAQSSLNLNEKKMHEMLSKLLAVYKAVFRES